MTALDEREVPSVLSEALTQGINPLCIEIDITESPQASMRSSNSSALVPLDTDTARKIIEWLRRTAGLPVTPNKGQTAWLIIRGEQYITKFCPQLHGEIVLLHRQS